VPKYNNNQQINVAKNVLPSPDLDAESSLAERIDELDQISYEWL
jgi:hypothetical protein